jgi:RimJ/RimL family protein N-acetyltransferase
MIPGTLTNLRAVDRSDLDRIHAWLDDPELMRSWGYGAPAVSRANAARRLEEWLADELLWDHPAAFIVETLDGRACGLLILSRISSVDRSCELSIFLEPSIRGHGIGTDVIETIADAAFSQWNFHRLSVQSEEHNTSAHAFFVRQGFALEGRQREARYLDGAWHDILIFGRLRNDQGANE